MSEFVSCIITHNRPDKLASTLQGLCSQNELPTAIIILDNGTTVRSVDGLLSKQWISWAASEGIDVVVRYSEPLGMANARHECEKLAHTLYPKANLHACDDDQGFMPNFVKDMKEALETYDVSGSRIANPITKEVLGTINEFKRITPRIFHGGTICYRPWLVGLYDTVRAITPDIGEDNIWFRLAHAKKARFMPGSKLTNCHCHLDENYYIGKYQDGAVQMSLKNLDLELPDLSLLKE